jgi:hypothetical protein
MLVTFLRIKIEAEDSVFWDIMLFLKSSYVSEEHNALSSGRKLNQAGNQHEANCLLDVGLSVKDFEW